MADVNAPPFLRETDRAREMANDILKGRNPPSDKTKARYCKLWGLICKRGGLEAILSGGCSRGYYYQLRAAALFHHVERIDAALKELDLEFKGVAPDIIERLARDVINAVEDLQRLDPDFARERYNEKSGSLWKEECAKTGGKPQSRRSKKTSIRGLTFDHLVRLWEKSSRSKYRDALAVALATGCRPAEITLGVGIDEADGACLLINVSGGKLTERTGVPLRSIGYIGNEAPWLSHLLERARNGVEQVTFEREQQTKYFSTTVGRWSDKLWPERRDCRITPYSLRNWFSSQLKRAFKGDKDKVGAALGHRSPESQSHYARRSAAGMGPFPIPVRVETGTGLEKTHETPAPGSDSTRNES